jgi:hypothetical protein
MKIKRRAGDPPKPQQEQQDERYQFVSEEKEYDLVQHKGFLKIDPGIL